MRLRLLTALALVAAAIIAVACSSPGGPPAQASRASTSAPASQTVAPLTVDGLASRAHLTVVGVYRTVETTIPTSLDGLPWAQYQSAAASAGFDFSSYRGDAVTITGYTASETIDGSPVRLWVVRFEGKVIGAYYTVDAQIPGIHGIGQ